MTAIPITPEQRHSILYLHAKGLGAVRIKAILGLRASAATIEAVYATPTKGK